VLLGAEIDRLDFQQDARGGERPVAGAVGASWLLGHGPLALIADN
jgi:hypothetical protein